MTTRAKAISGLSAVFLLGGLVGALIIGVVMREHVREAQALRQHDGFVEFFEKQLQLTAQQRDSLRDVLNETFRQLAVLRASTSEQFNQVIDTLKKRIYPQLTATQRELFAEEEQKFRRLVPREAPPRLAAAAPRAGTSGEPRVSVASPADSAAPRRAPGDVVRTEPNTPAQTMPRIDPAPVRTDSVNTQNNPPTPHAADAIAPNPQDLVPQRTLDLLKLTPDQLSQFKAIRHQAILDVRQLAQTYRDNPVILRQMTRATVHDARVKVRNLLTPEQREILRIANQKRKDATNQ